MGSTFQCHCDGGELKCWWLSCLVENPHLIEAATVTQHKQTTTDIAQSLELPDLHCRSHLLSDTCV